MVNVSGSSSDLNPISLRRLKNWTGLAAISAFIIISFGSLVRATDSGLACPDWPLCYGELVPVFTWQIFFEWFHRLLAGLLAVSVVAASVMLMRDRFLRSQFGWAILLASIVLTIQIILGGLTVLKLLDPGIVSLHLINGVVFLSLLLMIHLKARYLLNGQAGDKPYHVSAGVMRSMRFITAAILAQVFVGGMVSTNGAGLVCPDFPQCFGMWWPPYSFLVNIQMTHRYFAFAIALGIFMFSALSMRLVLPPLTRWAVRLLPILVVGQILLGIANIFYYLPVWASVGHLANAVTMYAISLTATFELYFVARTYFIPADITTQHNQTNTSASHFPVEELS